MNINMVKDALSRGMMAELTAVALNAAAADPERFNNDMAEIKAAINPIDYQDLCDRICAFQEVDGLRNSTIYPGANAMSKAEDDKFLKIISALGPDAEITGIRRLPDGSGCCVGSFPLPPTHWLLREEDEVEYKPLPYNPSLSERICSCAKQALRQATDRDRIKDFDPDAFLQNLRINLFGCCSTLEQRAGLRISDDIVKASATALTDADTKSVRDLLNQTGSGVIELERGHQVNPADPE